MANYYTDEARHEIAEALKDFLASTAVVYYKTHAFHWNVEGPNFYSLHLLFEKFYTELWESLDDVAERLRTFEEKAPSNLAELLKRTSITEAEATPSATVMVQKLKEDYLSLSEQAHHVCAIADKYGDIVTADLMTKNATFLEKAAWMLQSTLSS